LLVLTSLYPNRVRPRHGIFVATRLRRMCATGRVVATVIAPVPSFPFAYRASAGVAAVERQHELDVRHPRFLNIPAVGMRLQPGLLARAVLSDLRRSGLGRDRFDVVDAHYFYPDGVAAARVADALALPLVITARGSDINLIGQRPFARRAMVAASKRAQALIAVSAALGQRMISLGMPASSLHVLRNGVDMDVFRPVEREKARTRIGMGGAGPLVLGVGNLVHEKGFDLLVRAVAAWPQARLLLLGEGPEHERLRALGQALAPGRVELRPSVPQADLPVVYSAADVLGLPSHREGWPNVLLEAMACGTPVVAANVGGVPEMVRGAAAGMSVQDRSVDGWSTALRHVATAGATPDDVRAYAGQFQWDEVVQRQCALYEAVAQGRSGPAVHDVAGSGTQVRAFATSSNA
jgi:glycosyltransferase involved in cell wall biosynthesis